MAIKSLQFSKKMLLKTHALTLLVSFLGIILLLNYVGMRYFFRLDLTQDRQYTISQSTRNILGNLDDIVTIKVFFSTKLPANLLSVSEYVRDILEEYTAFSNGNLQVNFIDPASDPKIREEVAMLGVPEIQMNIFEKDTFQVQNGYLGIGIFYVDKHEVLPFVQDTQNLEYQLTSAIRKVTAKETKVVGLLTEGENYQILREALGKNYEVRDMELGKPITDIHTLIVGGSKKTFTQRDIFEIDQYLMHGGNAIFLIDTLDLGEGLVANPVNNPDLSQFLEHFGVKVETNLVLDTLHENASFTQGFVQFILPYPLWPKLVNFSAQNPIVSKLESFVLPWSSSLSIQTKEGLNLETLAQTSKDGFVQSGNFNLDPNQAFSLPAETKSYDMVVLVSGVLRSFFEGKGIPPVTEGLSESVAEPTTNASQVSESKVPEATPQTSSESERRFIVMGDSDFISDGFVNRFPQNLDLALNMVDYLTLDDALIDIRSKGASDRPLKVLSDSARASVKYFGILGMPIAVAVYGILRLHFRKRKSDSLL